MTNEDQIPDGWIAWHPEHGPAWESASETHMEINRSWLDAVRVCMGKGDGWRIRPVKLTFLDEGK